jgi:predicted negative regulator of RcsB-dependent stress response
LPLIIETLTMFGRRPTKPSAPGSRRDAWYRSDEWDEAAQTEFETRLRRSKPLNRVQYRRIKAIGLLDSGDTTKQAAGRDLLEQVIADRDAYSHERVTAYCLLAAHEQETGKLDDAERHLRTVLEMMSDGNRSGSTQLEEVRLAEILLTRGGPGELAEAQDLLDGTRQSPPLLMRDRFRMSIAGVKVALALKDKRRAAEWASDALNLAAAAHSGLRNHPDLGLVATDGRTRTWLTTIAAWQG